MKRIYNEVPLGSLIYNIHMDQEIKIIDYYDSTYPEKNRDIVIYEGKMGLYRYSGIPHKIEYAAVKSITTEGDMLVFGVCTRKEKY